MVGNSLTRRDIHVQESRICLSRKVGFDGTIDVPPQSI
jgi:hypothetical protein